MKSFALWESYALFRKRGFILIIYLALPVLITLGKYFSGPKKYNNFIIFKGSLPHLLEGKNLYVYYPTEYFDLFLYHPTFPILFAVFSLIPTLAGMLLWQTFSSFSVFYAISKLNIAENKKVFIWWYSLLSTLTCIYYFQTNAVIAACVMLTFIFLEEDKPHWAAFFPVLAFCIKIYGAIGCLLFLFYPQKFKYIIYSFLWLLALTLLPLFTISVSALQQNYIDWYHTLTADYKVNLGLSLIGLCYVWFTDQIAVGNYQIVGLLMLFTTLIYRVFRHNSFQVRTEIYAYITVWTMMFNHAIESSGYIITVIAIATWFAVKEPTTIEKALLIFTFVFGIMVSADFYPKYLKVNFLNPFLIEVVPFACLWAYYQYRLLGKT